MPTSADRSCRHLERTDCKSQSPLGIITMNDNTAKLSLGSTWKLSPEFRMFFENFAHTGKYPRQRPILVEDQQGQLGISPGRIAQQLIYLFREIGGSAPNSALRHKNVLTIDSD
jgi:hypothetical protein